MKNILLDSICFYNIYFICACLKVLLNVITSISNVIIVVTEFYLFYIVKVYQFSLSSLFFILQKY